MLLAWLAWNSLAMKVGLELVMILLPLAPECCTLCLVTGYLRTQFSSVPVLASSGEHNDFLKDLRPVTYNILTIVLI